MRLPRTPLVLLATLSLLTASLSACGGSGSSDSSQGKGLEKTNIKVVSLPVVDEAPLFVALKNKLFEKEGLKVTPMPFNASVDANAPFAKGDIDIMFGNYVSFFQAQAAGALNIRVIADGSQTSNGSVALQVMPKSTIKTPKDLEGKKVAVLIHKGWQEIVLDAYLRSQNVDPSKVQYRYLPLPQMLPAMQKGEIDAAFQGEPFVTAAGHKLGARSVFNPCSGPVADWPLIGYLSTAQWAQKYPKTAAAFQRAISKAEELSTDRKQVEAVVPSYAHIDSMTASAMSLPTYPTSVSVTRLQRVADLMVSEGLLKQKLDTKSLIFTPPAK